MNLDITCSGSFFKWWFRITLFELDCDSTWGFSLGVLRVAIASNNNDSTDERSLLFINKTKYMSRFDIGFLKIIEKYK